MGNITIEQEQALRAEIAADLATITLCGNVFDRRRAFDGREDFLKRTQVAIGTGSTKTKEVRYTEIELLDITDSDEGFEDCPIPLLTYGLHLFHEFKDTREDDSNSDHDFTHLLLQLRTFFNNKRKYAGGLAETDPGIMPKDGTEFTQYGADTFTEIVGHSKDLTLKVFYYDQPQP